MYRKKGKILNLWEDSIYGKMGLPMNKEFVVEICSVDPITYCLDHVGEKVS